MESKTYSKIEATIEGYSRFTFDNQKLTSGGLKESPEDKRGTLRDYFRNVVSRFSDKSREIIEKVSLGESVQGELVLYDLLSNAGIDDLASAQAAVLYPNPSKFDPTIIGNNKILRAFREKIEAKQKPLEALVEIAETFTNVNNDYKIKLTVFKDFVEISKRMSS